MTMRNSDEFEPEFDWFLDEQLTSISAEFSSIYLQVSNKTTKVIDFLLTAHFFNKILLTHSVLEAFGFSFPLNEYYVYRNAG